MVLRDMLAQLGVVSRGTAAPLWDSPEGSGEGKSSQWAGTLGGAPEFSLCLEGEMARHVIIHRFVGCGQWFGWMVRNLGQT